MNVINLVEYVSLDSTAEEWARRIIEVSKKPRKNTYKLIKEAGYDISTVTEWLQNFYLEKSEVKEYENRNFNAL